MRKIAAAAFLLSAVLAAATPLASQTRPRRVTPADEETGYSESQPRGALSRPRTAGSAVESPRSGRRSLAGTLLRVGMTAAVLGTAGRGASCAPSRRQILLGGISAGIRRYDHRR